MGYRGRHRGYHDLQPAPGRDIHGAGSASGQGLLPRRQVHVPAVQAFHQDARARRPDHDSLRGRRGRCQGDGTLLQVSALNSFAHFFLLVSLFFVVADVHDESEILPVPRGELRLIENLAMIFAWRGVYGASYVGGLLAGFLIFA